MDKVIELSAKGNELSWGDFEKYSSTETGSGLYILHYEVDENYDLLITDGFNVIAQMIVHFCNSDDAVYVVLL